MIEVILIMMIIRLITDRMESSLYSDLTAHTLLEDGIPISSQRLSWDVVLAILAWTAEQSWLHWCLKRLASKLLFTSKMWNLENIAVKERVLSCYRLEFCSRLLGREIFVQLHWKEKLEGSSAEHLSGPNFIYWISVLQENI